MDWFEQELPRILFGYRRGPAMDGSPGNSIYLYKDGALVTQHGSCAGRDERQVHFKVSPACLREIARIISENEDLLRSYREKINGGASPEGENCFIFDGMWIIDWDLTRWYLEEDRKKHPEYYKSSVKVTLTETYVRGIFDEICAVLEADEKEICYARTVMRL